MKIAKISLRYSLILGTVALVCTALLSVVYILTKERINEAITNQQKQLLMQVIPVEMYDNDLLASCYKIDKVHAKNPSIYNICEARKAGEIKAYAYETLATDGYSGNIRMLVGLTPEGEVLGVRILEHKETPGLGDKIELRISDWILSFSHRLLTSEHLQDWAVKKRWWTI